MKGLKRCCSSGASSAFSIHKLRTYPFMERGSFFGYFFAEQQKVTGSLSETNQGRVIKLKRLTY